MTDDYETFFDTHCDSCKFPKNHKCEDLDYCPEQHPTLECCQDNLKKNVGELCFKYNVPQNVAVAIIKILEKERERNELMYVHREYLLERGFETDTDNGSAEIQRGGE